MPRTPSPPQVLPMLASAPGAMQSVGLQPQAEALGPFVELLLRLASRFINLPLAQVDAEIQCALQDMGEFVAADRAYLFSYDFVAETSSNTHEWCAPGIEPQLELLQGLPFSMSPDWWQAHRLGQTLHVPDVAALPPGRLQELLLPQGILTLIALPLMRADGACTGFVGFDFVRSQRRLVDKEVDLLQLFAQMLVNVAERGRVESELRELNRTLEARVAERTAELAAARDEAQAANEGKSAFMARMSHELRTPLNAVLGFSQLLALDPQLRASPTALQQLQHVRAAGEHLLGMVDELLDLASIEAGGLRLRLERLDLAVLASESLALVQPLASRHQVQLQGPSGDLPCWVLADRMRLRQVLVNLLSNAVKYNRPEGHVELRLEARPGQGVVSVRDSGVGMSPQQLAALFQPFNRLGAEAGPVEGTGLGLAIAHQLALAMHGQLQVDSVAGVGTRFVLTLPLPAGAGATPANGSAAAAGPAPS